MFIRFGRERGLTLLELLITLVVGSVISAVAIPNLARLVQDARRTTVINQLVHSVQLARTQSVMRDRVVVVCGSRDGERCGAERDWQHGWIVFVDLDGRPGQRRDDEPLLQTFKTGEGQTVRVSIAGGAPYFQLRPVFNTRSSNGTLTLCDRRGAAAARAVVIGVLGRPYVSTRDGSRRPLVCA